LFPIAWANKVHKQANLETNGLFIARILLYKKPSDRVVSIYTVQMVKMMVLKSTVKA